MTRKRKAILTGATGYIGYHLAKKLLTEDWEICAVVRPDSKIQKLKKLSPALTFQIHDGSTQKMIRIFEAARPQIVFHLASYAVVDHQPEDIESMLRSNIIFGTQILEAMIKTDTQSIVNTGSHWQHFKGADYSPVNLYAAAKQAFEDVLRFYTEARGIRAITLKLFNVYGPEDSRGKLFALFEKATRAGEPLAVSPGQQYLDMVYIDDAVRAYERAADMLFNSTENYRHQSYAVSSARPMSLRAVAEIYQRVRGKKIDLRWGKKPYRSREVMQLWTGPQLPGWRAEVDLEEGVGRISSADKVYA